MKEREVKKIDMEAVQKALGDLCHLLLQIAKGRTQEVLEKKNLEKMALDIEFLATQSIRLLQVKDQESRYAADMLRNVFFTEVYVKKDKSYNLLHAALNFKQTGNDEKLAEMLRGFNQKTSEVFVLVDDLYMIQKTLSLLAA